MQNAYIYWCSMANALTVPVNISQHLYTYNTINAWSESISRKYLKFSINVITVYIVKLSKPTVVSALKTLNLAGQGKQNVNCYIH
jgi:hypothetical protein